MVLYRTIDPYVLRVLSSRWANDLYLGLASIRRTMTITAALNRLTFNDAEEVRALLSELISKKMDDSFVLIPPFYTTGGTDMSFGRRYSRHQGRSTKYPVGGNPAKIIRSIGNGKNSRRRLNF